MKGDKDGNAFYKYLIDKYKLKEVSKGKIRTVPPPSISWAEVDDY